MDILSLWIKQIILLVLFATFLELLIPSNSYKKFIKVIMGLLILVTVLQPFLHLMQKPWDETSAAEVAARNITDNQGDISLQATELLNERERIALEQYRKELIKQIKVLAGAVEGISDIKAEVSLNEDKGEKNYGMIKNITVYAKAGFTDKNGAIIKSVKPVEITPLMPHSQEYGAVDEEKQREIKRIVAEFFHLKTEQVVVKEWPGK